MSDVLSRIEAYKRQEIATAKAAVPLDDMKRRALEAPPPRGFAAAFVIAQFIAVGGSCFATEWGYAIAFLFFMMMVFIRPQGLFARRT